VTCPATKPADESTCQDQSAICPYPSSFCRCRWTGSSLAWDCPS
jgi:hypothetical protein